jgi:hypothetical protein
MTPSVLVRIRFTSAVLERLDALAAELRTLLRRRIPRAALVRALVKLGLAMPATSPGLASALRVDTVRRGREKGAVQTRRAAP